MSQRDGTIRRETSFPEKPAELVLSGPHFSVGNPLNKTPRVRSTRSSDYDCLDLTTLPDDYLPRTIYIPACDTAEYLRRTPKVSWISENETDPKPVTDFYRAVTRGMVNASWSRTLTTTLIPKRVATIHAVVSTAFRDALTCIDFLAVTTSIVLDFFVKSSGTGNVNLSWLSRLPILSELCNPALRNALRVRALSLSCLTTHYADLWEENLQHPAP